ncbi:LCP family protein [Actinomycetota bacterium Odt1-20B]
MPTSPAPTPTQMDPSPPTPAGRRRIPRRRGVAALLAAALVCGASVAAATTPADPPAPRGGKGTNILVVGLDRRSGMSKKEIQHFHVGGKECNCTDVMMLVHLAADRRRLSVVSIPRDSYLPFAAHEGGPAHSGKINGAYQEGGPDLTVRTVERATGLRVDHYLETDFRGFAGAVDHFGGAQVCTDKPLRDLGSGLKLASGTHWIDGRTALRYVRARHVSPPGDLGRVRRQQRLVLGMLDRLADAGALRNPYASAYAARALYEHVRTDPHTGPGELAALAWSMRDLTAERTEFATVPISDFDHPVPDWGSTLLWDAPRARALFTALREDRPLVTPRTGAEPAPVDMPPAWVRVRVDDAATAEALRADGFDVAATPRQGSPAKGPTVITYDPAMERYAATLATALPGARLRQVPGQGREFRVTVGAAPQRVAKVTYDRSSVEGAPVTGDQLRCR